MASKAWIVIDENGNMVEAYVSKNSAEERCKDLEKQTGKTYTVGSVPIENS